MAARGVFVRLGCTFVAAGISLFAQYSAEYGVGTWGDGVRAAVTPIRVYSPTNTPVPAVPRPGDATISLKRLAHEVPDKAIKAWEQGSKAARKMKWEEAATHFKEAIQIDPEYVEAVNDLGAAYAKLHRLGDAIDQFGKAVKLDSHYAPGFYNLALIYLIQEKLTDAEIAARAAVDANRTSNLSKLVLGMSLVLQDKFTDEAVTMLRKANEDFPQAHLFLARALAGRGETESARSEIQTYLASGDKSGEELAESWLKALP